MTKAELDNRKILPLEDSWYRRVKEKLDGIAKPLDGLGKFEHLIAQIGAIEKTTKISIQKKAVLVMCADNGVVEEQVSQSGKEVTLAVAKAMGVNNSSVGKMAAVAGVDVIPVDIGIDTDEVIPGVLPRKVAKGTKNFAKEPAMVQQCHREGYEILATGEMGIGNTTTSTAVAAALLDLEVEQVTGKGAGLTDEALKRKCRVIEEAIEKYFLRDADALGGLDIAGLTGVFIGAAIEQIPVVIDGVISAVAALLAETFCKGAVNYMIPSHKSRELAETAIMKKLHLDPVLDADMALGEGTGAVMMMSLLDVALGVYLQGASFANFEIEQYKRYEE